MTTTKVTDATLEPIALDEAKRHLRGLADGDTDPDITQLITDARTAAENRMQRSILPTGWLHTRDAFPDCIQLHMPPVTEIAWVKYIDLNGVLQTLDPAQYQVDMKKEPAEITPAYGVTWPATRAQAGAVSVQYTAGYATAAQVPGPIKRWIKLALTDIYENRGRSSDRPAVPQDFADELLDPYVIHTI